MKSKRLLLAVLMSAPMALGVTSCGSSNDASKHTIRILNLEDYIYINDPESGYDEEDLVVQFEKYANEKFGYNDVHVVYDTSDTNESEYNDLLTGRINYDLVCTSDYMLQKFVREDLVVPLNKEALVNYNTYASPVIKQRLDQISVKKGEEVVYLEDYAVGYMWGTLGLLMNANYLGEDHFDSFINDAQSWDILWNKDYKNVASIKNSMRDTYAVALMHGYDSALEALKLAYNDGDISAEDYNASLSEIFNRTDEATRNMVKEELSNLKDNIFGMEVDSGKQDIVTGKIGLNLAWSGDAVYSMDQAEDPELVSNPFELYYAIPENGSNVWFDGWAIPKNDKRDQETYDLAIAFLDYLSDPVIASKNMDYTGYTSFIGGDSILELVRDWYDIRTDEIYFDIEGEEETITTSIHRFNPDTEEFAMLDYLDFISTEHDDSLDDELLYYYIPHNKDEEGNLIEEADSFIDLMENGGYIYLDEEGEMVIDDATLANKTYGDLTIVDDPENELEEINLTYFFGGTLDEYEEIDMLFYSDCYLPYSNEDGTQNISVGRQFFCQYPNEETILRCAVMADYGDENIKIVKLWEDFKSNPLPTWAVILIIVEVVLAVLVLAYFWLSKRIKKTLRMKRIGEKINNK